MGDADRYLGQDLVEAGLSGLMPPEDALGYLLGNLGPKTPANRPDFTNPTLLIGVGQLFGRLVIDSGLSVPKIATSLLQVAATALRALL